MNNATLTLGSYGATLQQPTGDDYTAINGGQIISIAQRGIYTGKRHLQYRCQQHHLRAARRRGRNGLNSLTRAANITLAAGAIVLAPLSRGVWR